MTVLADHTTDFQVGSFPTGWTYAWRADTASDGSDFSVSDWTNFSASDATKWYGPDSFSTPQVLSGRMHPGSTSGKGCVLVSYQLATTGSVQITGTINRTTGTGNVRVFVFHGTTVLHNVLTNTTTNSTSFDVTVSGVSGDRITLAADRVGNFGSDTTDITLFRIATAGSSAGTLAQQNNQRPGSLAL